MNTVNASVLVAIWLLIWMLISAEALGQQAHRPGANKTSGAMPIDTQYGFLVQPQATFHADEANDGFALRTARIRLKSGRERKFSLFLQSELARSPVVLDARITLMLAPQTMLNTGLFKSPFSREFLVFPGDLPLAERARVVRALAPGRQVGVSLQTALFANKLKLQGGVFNGNGGRLEPNDNDRFLYVIRADWMAPLRSGEIKFGINLGYSLDEHINVPQVSASFSGERSLIGIDGEISWKKWILTSEFIAAQLDENDGGTNRPYGYFVTLGHRLRETHHVSLSLDGIETASTSNKELILGYKVFLTDVVRVLANYSLPLGNESSGMFLVRLQFAMR